MNKLLHALQMLRTSMPRDMAALTMPERRDLARQLDHWANLAREWDKPGPASGVLAELRTGRRAP